MCICRKSGIERLLGVARQLRLPGADAIEIFRRMVINVIARNHDDHSKNFGFLLKDKNSQWRLAPAFDIAYSYKPGSPWVNDHQLTLNGKRDNFTREDLLEVASLISNFKRQANELIDQISAVIGEWQNYAKKSGVFPVLRKEVQSNLRLGNEYSW